MEEDKLEAKFEEKKDLIDDSLDFCADIYNYYETDELFKLDFVSFIKKRNNLDENVKVKTETVVIKQVDEESGVRLYAKIVAIILAAMIVAKIISTYIVQETIVSGTSMMPTLENADKVLIDKVIYKADDLKRYDIIVFDYNHSNVYVKRIVGLPGEKVMIIEGEVYVNGKKLRDDPLLNDTMEYAGIAENSIQLGEDEYFVLGDNRNNSYDSYFKIWSSKVMKNISEIREEYANCNTSNLGEFVAYYGTDNRSGVKKIVEMAQKKLIDYDEEISRVSSMAKFERQFSENGYICGVDEVGRGPLAGPVVAAAVIFPKDLIIPYVNDSKKLKESKREELFNHIMSEAISVGFGSVDNSRIDEINILQSTFEAMKQAVSDLNIKPDIILVDGNKKIPGLDIMQHTIVSGDAKSLSIAAASIVAKVVRDRYMKEMDIKYPMYDFASNKGYGSKKHYTGIKEFGISPIHRKTFIHG